jgi:SAM-dependent methyltransferase
MAGEPAPTRWEQVAHTRWGRYTTEIERTALHVAVDACRAESRALEIGCEGGRWSAELVAAGWEMTCTDVDAAALDVCRRRLPTARCVLTKPEATELPAETGSLGLVLCYEVFPIVHESWLLAEVARVIAPGGIFLAVVSNRTSYRRWLWQARNRVSGRDEQQSEPDMYCRSYRSWRAELLNLGFEAVSEEGFCWMPFSRESDSRLIPVTTHMEKMVGLRRVVQFSPWIVAAMRRTAASG